jgi:hypothetical protein
VKHDHALIHILVNIIIQCSILIILDKGQFTSFNNNYRVSQFKSSTQIIHKILKLKEQNDTNHPIHKIK